MENVLDYIHAEGLKHFRVETRKGKRVTAWASYETPAAAAEAFGTLAATLRPGTYDFYGAVNDPYSKARKQLEFKILRTENPDKMSAGTSISTHREDVIYERARREALQEMRLNELEKKVDAIIEALDKLTNDDEDDDEDGEQLINTLVSGAEKVQTAANLMKNFKL